MTQDRRTFLKAAGAAASMAAVGGCGPGEEHGDAGAQGARRLDAALLGAVGAVVLPGELGDAGRDRAVQEFLRWATAYEAVPELNHGYGTSEIRYGPPDPVPAWQAQLEALDLEATKRHGEGLVALADPARDALVRRHIGDEGPGVPDALRARHVAVALLSHWLQGPDATDRCYGAQITPRTCRGIEGAPGEPEALG